jgi:hypothetical protein
MRMQMAMIAYSTFDIFDEKQKITVAQEGEVQFRSYLGLLLESFVGQSS